MDSSLLNVPIRSRELSSALILFHSLVVDGEKDSLKRSVRAGKIVKFRADLKES